MLLHLVTQVATCVPCSTLPPSRFLYCNKRMLQHLDTQAATCIPCTTLPPLISLTFYFKSSKYLFDPLPDMFSVFAQFHLQSCLQHSNQIYCSFINQIISDQINTSTQTKPVTNVFTLASTNYHCLYSKFSSTLLRNSVNHLILNYHYLFFNSILYLFPANTLLMSLSLLSSCTNYPHALLSSFLCISAHNHCRHALAYLRKITVFMPHYPFLLEFAPLHKYTTQFLFLNQNQHFTSKIYPQCISILQ